MRVLLPCQSAVRHLPMVGVSWAIRMTLLAPQQRRVSGPRRQIPSCVTPPREMEDGEVLDLLHPLAHSVVVAHFMPTVLGIARATRELHLRHFPTRVFMNHPLLLKPTTRLITVLTWDINLVITLIPSPRIKGTTLRSYHLSRISLRSIPSNHLQCHSPTHQIPRLPLGLRLFRHIR